MASCSRPTKKLEGETTNGPNWLELPREVTTHIFRKLSVVEILMIVSQVCSLWWNICKDPFMWRTIVMKNDVQSSPYNLVKICCAAIRRSRGQVEEINIECFGTTDLLTFMANSCTSNLRRLRLARCGKVLRLDTSFLEILKNSPLLEELDISFTLSSNVYLDDIGRCCPLLKVLKYNQMGFESSWMALADADDYEAVALAKTSHQLRHLQIMGSFLTNYGLLAILNGCPRLEFLDLRSCLNVDLSGSLGKRLHEQIKYLRLPLDEDKISDDYPKLKCH